MSMRWFDSHAHLQDEAFVSDWRLVLERAAAQNIYRILLPASDIEDSCRAIELACKDPRFCCSVGCHPHEASGFDDVALHRMEQLIADYQGDPVVAVGETGLDYHYDFSPRPVQQEVFRAQLRLAYRCDLPLIIHEREATADCLGILREVAANGELRPTPGVFHCYSGSPETAEILLGLGFYLGIDGPVTFRNAKKIPEVILNCPHDRLLLETDSPYLTPEPFRGKRNEPGYLPLIAEKVAKIWQIPLSDVSRITLVNACKLFRLPLPVDLEKPDKPQKIC